MMSISPSLLAADPLRLEQEIRRAESWGSDSFHIDVMDHHFAPDIGFRTDTIRRICSVTDRPVDVHLMVSNPRVLLDELIDIGIDSLVFHPEAAEDCLQLLMHTSAKFNKAGIAISPDLDISNVLGLLPYCKAVLVMSIFPGFAGSKFQTAALQRIQTLRAFILPGHTVEIMVDGGIDSDIAQQCFEAGADKVIIGSALFGAQNPEHVVQSIKRVLHE